MNRRNVTLATAAATLMLGLGLSAPMAADAPGVDTAEPPRDLAQVAQVPAPADPARPDVPAVLVPGASAEDDEDGDVSYKRCARKGTTPCYQNWCPFPDPVWRFQMGSINADGDCVPGHWAARKAKRRHCGC